MSAGLWVKFGLRPLQAADGERRPAGKAKLEAVAGVLSALGLIRGMGKYGVVSTGSLRTVRKYLPEESNDVAGVP